MRRFRGAAIARAWSTLMSAALFSFVTSQRAVGQIAPQPAPAHMHTMPMPANAEPGSELVVYLLTIGQGDEVWERFGHNAIWIADRRSGISTAFNWGVFDFRQPGFVPRFLAATMLYSMDGNDAGATLSYYRQLNRTIWIQELALTPVQRIAIRDFIEWNIQPEHRDYHYDYFRDNCSTRVRDALDRALGGALRVALVGRPTTSTYRSETRRLTADQILTYAGIQAALGEPADHPLDAWQESFIPMRLRDHLRSLRVSDGAGGTRPLVLSEQIPFVASRAPERTAPPDRRPQFLAVGFFFAAFLVGLGRAARHGSAAARRGFTIASSAWMAISGFLGVLLLIAWLATQHVFWYRNENLLQLSPLGIALAIAMSLSGRRESAAGVARGVSLVIAVLSLAGLLLKPLALHQVNGEIIALALPVHLAVAAVLWKMVPTHGIGAASSTPMASAA